MIEPTESESVQELDRFCEAMLSIRREIQEVIDGKVDAEDNVLKMAPHTADELVSSVWPHAYTPREGCLSATLYSSSQVLGECIAC